MIDIPIRFGAGYDANANVIAAKEALGLMTTPEKGGTDD